MRIVVLGAGESGAGAAVLAKVKGFDTFVSDMSAIKDKYKELLDKYGIAWEEGHHTEELILNADEVVKSPGIPNDAPLIMKLKEKGTPIISEIEFAGRYTDAKMVCITGSNGKTTTTSLIYHIFKSAGLNVGLAGNIGKGSRLFVLVLVLHLGLAHVHDAAAGTAAAHHGEEQEAGAAQHPQIEDDLHPWDGLLEGGVVVGHGRVGVRRVVGLDIFLHVLDENVGIGQLVADRHGTVRVLLRGRTPTRWRTSRSADRRWPAWCSGWRRRPAGAGRPPSGSG